MIFYFGNEHWFSVFSPNLWGEFVSFAKFTRWFAVICRIYEAICSHLPNLWSDLLSFASLWVPLGSVGLAAITNWRSLRTKVALGTFRGMAAERPRNGRGALPGTNFGRFRELCTRPWEPLQLKTVWGKTRRTSLQKRGSYTKSRTLALQGPAPSPEQTNTSPEILDVTKMLWNISELYVKIRDLN